MNCFTHAGLQHWSFDRQSCVCVCVCVWNPAEASEPVHQASGRSEEQQRQRIQRGQFEGFVAGLRCREHERIITTGRCRLFTSMVRGSQKGEPRIFHPKAMTEVLKAESGAGVLGRGQQPPPYQLGGLGSAVSSHIRVEPWPPEGFPQFSAHSGWPLTTLSLSLRFKGNFSRWTWVCRCLLKQRMMELGGDNWTTGCVSIAKLQSNHHHQQTNMQFLQAVCPSWHPTNSVKALKGKYHIPWTCLPQAHLGVFQLCLWPLIAPLSTQDGLSWHYNIVNCGLQCSHWGSAKTPWPLACVGFRWPGKSAGNVGEGRDVSGEKSGNFPHGRGKNHSSTALCEKRCCLFSGPKCNHCLMKYRWKNQKKKWIVTCIIHTLCLIPLAPPFISETDGVNKFCTQMQYCQLLPFASTIMPECSGVAWKSPQ